MALMGALLKLAIDVYIFVIIIQVALSWLLTFEVINANNPQAQNLIRLMRRLTDPLYRPLRKYVPPIGGIDITPLILIIGLSIVQGFIVQLFSGQL